MNPILACLQASGTTLRAEGGNLHVSPKEAVTSETLELIRAHKAELLQVVGRSESKEGEVRRLVATIYAKDTPEDQAEALRHALSDPDGARECYRWILSWCVH